MKALTTICALIAVPLVAFAGDDAAKKAPAAGAPAPVKQAEPAKPAPPPPPTPAKELDMAKPYAKNWNCTGTSPAGEKENAKLSWKLDLNKFWYAVRMDVAKSKTSPGFTGMGWVGVDPVGKNWVFIGFDSAGGWINLKGAMAAVTAESAVFEGDANDPRGKVPAKFTMKHDTKAKTMTFVGEFGGQKAFDYTCK